MTRKEAIRCLYVHSSTNGSGLCTDKQHYEAKQMAIKALEQEPCEDWCDIPADEMTLEQAKQAVKDLRKKLAEYIEQEPCEDAISRQAAIDGLNSINGTSELDKAFEVIENLPPVNPQPKTGHWIVISPTDMYCSECNEMEHLDTSRKFCARCGAIMVETQESEGAE